MIAHAVSSAEICGPHLVLYDFFSQDHLLDEVFFFEMRDTIILLVLYLMFKSCVSVLAV